MTHYLLERGEGGVLEEVTIQLLVRVHAVHGDVGSVRHPLREVFLLGLLEVGDDGEVVLVTVLALLHRAGLEGVVPGLGPASGPPPAVPRHRDLAARPVKCFNIIDLELRYQYQN